MIGLIQRVKQANVSIGGETVGEIEQGIMLLLGVEKHDTEASAARLCQRVLNYRIFNDEQGKMNLNLQQIGGELMVVSQFTLVADTSKGNRPGFSRGATPEQGRVLYHFFVDQARAAGIEVATGRFGADMQVSLVNDGPVTFQLST